MLANQGIELQEARSAVERVIGRGEHPTKGEHPAKGEVGLTPRAKKVMELAVDEARHLNHRYIGTEHLLLGLVREGHGIAAGVLESLGATLQRTRAETLSVLSTHVPRGDDVAGLGAPPPIPTEAAALLGEGEQALVCSACEARNPRYFRYCFNCGQRLESE